MRETTFENHILNTPYIFAWIHFKRKLPTTHDRPFSPSCPVPLIPHIEWVNIGSDRQSVHASFIYIIPLPYTNAIQATDLPSALEYEDHTENHQ